MTARIYLPEFGMRDVRLGARVRLQPESRAMPLTSALSAVAPASATMEAGIVPKDQLNGIVPPRYYIGSALVRNDGELRQGMTGNAKIFVNRRSLAGFVYIFAHDLIARKVW